MSLLNASALDDLLGAIDWDLMTLHSGDPGAAGTDNVISAAPVAITWDTPEAHTSGRKVHLAADVDFTGATPTTTVAYLGLWKDGTPDVFKGYITRSTGDAATNAAGEYTVDAASTYIPLDMAGA